MGDYAVHRCRVFDCSPKSVQCMASHESSAAHGNHLKILAVGRENGAIELMKLTTHGFYTYMTIPGSSDRNLEDLLFCNGRLFSAELQGVISEYDLQTGMVVYSEDCYGGAVWCLATGQGNLKIAAGCEDGSLKIFDCSRERITFEKSLDKQDGRILSCAFHPDNEIIVSGSVDTIRIWSYKTGHAIQRIRVEASKKMENIVWAVKILSDHTIISGDSTGKVSFWNGKNATLLHSFQNHCADVLSICVSDDESAVYAAGVDPKVIALHRSDTDNHSSMIQTPVGMEAPPKVSNWVKGALLQAHTHDVRALAIVGDYLASGSVDTNILLHNLQRTSNRKRSKISPFPHQSIVHLAQNARLLLLQYARHLDIWSLGSPESTTGQVGEVKSLIEEPSKIFQINTSSNELGDISRSTISQCGRWVAFSTKTVFKLFWLTWVRNDPTKASVTKVSTRWVKLPSAIAFSPDSEYGIVSSLSGKVFVMKLDKYGHAHLEHVVKSEDSMQRIPVVLLTANETYFVTVDLENKISVYFLTKPELKCVVPGQKCIPTALNFRPKTNYLVVAYQDQSVIEFDVESNYYTDWCKKATAAGLRLIEFPEKYKKGRPRKISNWNTSPIVNISFSNHHLDRIMFSSSRSIFVVERSIEKMENVIDHEKRRKSMIKEGIRGAWKIPEGFECPVKQFNNFELLLHGAFFDAGTSVLAVERSWKDIFDDLPPTLYQKKFGT